MKTVIVVALSLVATAALAADAAKIDFTTVLNDQDGHPLEECIEPMANPPLAPVDKACTKKQDITLGIVSTRALLTPEQNLQPEDSQKRGQLALSVYRSAGAQLTAEEVALIKKRIAAVYGPLIVARAFPLLDPATAAK